jgi:hypothetical protein
MENFINWLKKEKEVSTEEINNSLSVDDIINNVKAVYTDKLHMQSEQQVVAAKIAAPQTKPMVSPTAAGGRGQVPGPQKDKPKVAQAGAVAQGTPQPAAQPAAQPQPAPGQQAKPLVSDGGTVPMQIGGKTVQLPADPTERARMLQVIVQRGQGQVKN